jgi:hypothetical protein
MFISKYIRKPHYMEVKIHVRIGLSLSVVKFGLVWPELADFVAIVPKFERKIFRNMHSSITVGSYSIL